MSLQSTTGQSTTDTATVAIKQSFRITTSIPYVNAKPHIGHALEFVQADVLARYRRLCQHRVHFQIGTDENASKNALAAQQAGVTTAELVEANAGRFLALADRLQISHDTFVRTSSDDNHADAVKQFWRLADASGDIYSRQYRGLYCVGCELFYREAELADGLCPIHQRKPDVVEEKNYFFRLSRYQTQLCQLIESDQLQIVPKTRKNEILSFIRKGLQDFSISRDVERSNGWGLRVPDDPTQIIYVWFDALINYISGLGYSAGASDYNDFWSDATEITHVIGKDITRFHAIYWPAMLLSAGLPLPNKILVHGFISANGQKIAKSTGNVVDPVSLLDEYGLDTLRYYLIRHVPTTSDANYTNEIFAQGHNGELADQLGNLLQRVVRLLELHTDSKVPNPSEYTTSEYITAENALRDKATNLPSKISHAIENDALHRALAEVWEVVNAANKYIVEVRPWALAKAVKAPQDADQLHTCLYTLAESLRLIGVGLQPFLPQTAAEITYRVGWHNPKNLSWPEQLEWGLSEVNATVTNGPPLFPKLDR